MSGTKDKRRENPKAAEEAARWLLRLTTDHSAGCHTAFDEWVRESPVHIEEFLLAQAVSAELVKLDRVSADLLCARSDSSVVALDRSARLLFPTDAMEVPAGLKPRRWLGRIPLLIAAACIAAVAIGWHVLAPLRPGTPSYATLVGAQQSIKLDDGSVIQLNTSSRAEVHFDEEKRVVRLLEGEALFTVAHDAARPFFVTTDSASVRALGTQFNVYRSSASQTRVAVLEGIVQVAPQDQRNTPAALRLNAGEEAQVSNEHAVKTAAPDVDRAVAWRQRQLIFSDARLEDIAAEFNRYNRVQIRVDSQGLKDRRLSGIFDADDPTPLIEFVRQLADVVVERTDTSVAIRVRGSGPPNE